MTSRVMGWLDEFFVCNAGACPNPQRLTFIGGSGAAVGVQGPFNFTGWVYDFVFASSPPGYTQPIKSTQSSTQVTSRLPKLLLVHV